MLFKQHRESMQYDYKQSINTAVHVCAPSGQGGGAWRGHDCREGQGSQGPQKGRLWHLRVDDWHQNGAHHHLLDREAPRRCTFMPATDLMLQSMHRHTPMPDGINDCMITLKVGAVTFGGTLLHVHTACSTSDGISFP